MTTPGKRVQYCPTEIPAKRQKPNQPVPAVPPPVVGAALRVQAPGLPLPNAKELVPAHTSPAPPLYSTPGVGHCGLLKLCLDAVDLILGLLSRRALCSMASTCHALHGLIEGAQARWAALEKERDIGNARLLCWPHPDLEAFSAALDNAILALHKQSWNQLPLPDLDDPSGPENRLRQKEAFLAPLAEHCGRLLAKQFAYTFVHFAQRQSTTWWEPDQTTSFILQRVLSAIADSRWTRTLTVVLQGDDRLEKVVDALLPSLTKRAANGMPALPLLLRMELPEEAGGTVSVNASLLALLESPGAELLELSILSNNGLLELAPALTRATHLRALDLDTSLLRDEMDEHEYDALVCAMPQLQECRLAFRGANPRLDLEAFVQKHTALRSLHLRGGEVPLSAVLVDELRLSEVALLPEPAHVLQEAVAKTTRLRRLRMDKVDAAPWQTIFDGLARNRSLEDLVLVHYLDARTKEGLFRMLQRRAECAPMRCVEIGLIRPGSEDIPALRTRYPDLYITIGDDESALNGPHAGSGDNDSSTENSADTDYY